MPTVDESTQAQYLLVVIDHFTKYSWVFCLPSKDSKPIAERIFAVITEVQSQHTVVLMHTDNGKEFANSVLANVTESCGAHRITGRPYHPQSQGVVERKNRTIYSKLVKLAAGSPSNWAKEVQRVVVNENNQIAKTTGVRPHLLLWGHDHESFPGGGPTSQLSKEEWDKLKHEARTRMYQKAEKVQSAGEKRRPATKLNVGDHVLVKTIQRRERRLAKVLAPTFSVQAVITEVLKGFKFKIMWQEGWSGGKQGEVSSKSWHLKDLKKVHVKPTFDWNSAEELIPSKIIDDVDAGRGCEAVTPSIQPPTSSKRRRAKKKPEPPPRTPLRSPSAGQKSSVSASKLPIPEFPRLIPESPGSATTSKRPLRLIPESPGTDGSPKRSETTLKRPLRLIPESPGTDESPQRFSPPKWATTPKRRRKEDLLGSKSTTPKRRRTAAQLDGSMELGQELWDNGVNGCFFNAILSLLLVVKAWEPNSQQVAATCCPLLRAMLDCVPDWDSAELRRNRPTERVGVQAQLSQRARALRETCCEWFNASEGARGNYGGPHSIWQALFTDRYVTLRTGDRQEPPPIALPTPAELAATVKTFGCPASRHFLCVQCGHRQTASIRDICGSELLRIAAAPRLAVPLGQAVQNLLTGISQATPCSRNVPVPSSIQPGAVDTARCGGERSLSYSDAAPGRFFVLWFQYIGDREISDRCMPHWEPVISLALGQGEDKQSFQVVGIISYASDSKDHFIAKMLAPDSTWWGYNGLTNRHCSFRIPDIESFTTLDVAILFMKIASK
jgi:hypothetical protein